MVCLAKFVLSIFYVLMLIPVMSYNVGITVQAINSWLKKPKKE